MQVVSVNVGLPREVDWKGKRVTTSIFKDPVDTRIMLRRLNLDGDRQADLSVHGGPSKAVYLYPSEHYALWQQELPNMTLPWGMFGENLTTTGLGETALAIGDRLRIGTAEVMITEPRMPCYKLGIRFGRADILKRFLASRRSGMYAAVVKEGEIGASDSIEILSHNPDGVSVTDIVELYVAKKPDRALLERAVQTAALSESWRTYFQERLDNDAQ